MFHMYGWFTFLTCLGSVVGAVNWAAIMTSRANLFEGTDVLQLIPEFSINNPALLVPIARDISDKFTNAARWQVVANVLIPAEFAVVCVSKLLVLFRMLDFAVHDVIALEASSRFWLSVQRSAVVLVVCGNLIGLVGNILSAHEYLKIPSILSNAITNPKNPEAYTLFVDAFQTATRLHVYEEVSEAVVLLVIVVLFSAAGFMCARRLNAVMRGLPNAGEEDEAGSSARRLRKQIVTTVSVVFSTFLLRTAFALFVAVAYGNQNIAKCNKLADISQFCTNSCSDKCVFESALHACRLPDFSGSSGCTCGTCSRPNSKPQLCLSPVL